MLNWKEALFQNKHAGEKGAGNPASFPMAGHYVTSLDLYVFDNKKIFPEYFRKYSLNSTAI